LVKKMDDLFTRNFRNFHHPGISEQDYLGVRVRLGRRFKLIVKGPPGKTIRELYELALDPAEEHNLIDQYADVSDELEQSLHRWQTSVLNSLTEADYR